MKQILPKIFMLFVLASSFMLMSCEKEDGPVKAVISTDKVVIEPGESVTFINNSINAEHIVWEIEDGKTFNSETFTKTFNDPGAYKIKLKAYNSQREFDITEQIIFVGELNIKDIYLEEFNYVDENGQPWVNYEMGPGLEVFLKSEDTLLKAIVHNYDLFNLSKTKQTIPLIRFSLTRPFTGLVEPYAFIRIPAKKYRNWEIIINETVDQSNDSTTNHIETWSVNLYDLARYYTNTLIKNRLPKHYSVSRVDNNYYIFAQITPENSSTVLSVIYEVRVM